jgi:Flp pilus assembly protein TadD
VLSSAPPVRIDLPGKPVDYGNAQAVLAAAEARLRPGDVRLAVAHIMAGYRADRQAAIEALARLPQSSAVVAFNLGVAQLWDGRLTDATQSLLAAHRLNPYGFYGAVADQLLFSRSELAGYPLYFPPFSSPSQPVSVLQAQARAHPGSATAWLRLAVALERSTAVGARMQAIDAARRALTDDPTGIDPKVALAVLSFDKANPAVATGTLATMASNEPTNPEIRFHLGLVFFWIRRFQDAAGEMRQVVTSNPGPPYDRLAKVFETCLTSQTSCDALSKAAG